jgi:transcriptional regulator with GAF, ATPase, and Fis domain
MLSYASAPILREGVVIGFLNVYSRHPNTFTSLHAYYLQAFALQAGNAIRNAQLFAATQQHAISYEQQANRLALINRVSARIAQAIRLEDIYEIMTEELQTALNVSYAGLILYEGAGIGHLVMDTHPHHVVHRELDIPLDNNGSWAYICETHRALISSDVLNDPFFETTRDILSERGTRSMMVVPLVVGGEVIGSLGLDGTVERQFTDRMRNCRNWPADRARCDHQARLYAANTINGVLPRCWALLPKPLTAHSIWTKCWTAFLKISNTRSRTMRPISRSSRANGSRSCAPQGTRNTERQRRCVPCT